MGGLACVSWLPYKGRPVQMWSWLVRSSSPSRIWNGRWNRYGYRIQEQARRKVMCGVKGNTRRQCCMSCRQKANDLQPAQCMCIHLLVAWTLRRERHGLSAWVQCGGRGSLNGCTCEKEEATLVKDSVSEWLGTDTEDRVTRDWHWYWQQSDKGVTLTEWLGTDTDDRMLRD